MASSHVSFPSPFLPTVLGLDPQLARTPSWRAGAAEGWCPPCARLRLLRPWKRVNGDWAGTGQAGWVLQRLPHRLAGDWAACGHSCAVRAGRPQGASSSHSVSRDGRNTHQLTCLHDLVSLGFTPHCRRVLKLPVVGQTLAVIKTSKIIMM